MDYHLCSLSITSLVALPPVLFFPHLSHFIGKLLELLLGQLRSVFPLEQRAAYRATWSTCQVLVPSGLSFQVVIGSSL